VLVELKISAANFVGAFLFVVIIATEKVAGE
jgi:hypothetical protein